MNIFSYESKFSQVLLKISYSCWLNVMWTACSLPVFTIGASTAALYSVTLKIADDSEINVTKQFLKAFRENFRQATRIWLIMLGAGLFLLADMLIVYRLRTQTAGAAAVMWTLVFAFLIGSCVVYTIILLNIFPLVASVVNTDREMFKNAFLIGTHYLFATIMLFAIRFAMFFIVVAWFTPMIVFGEGLCVLISAWMLDRLLISVSGTPQDPKDEPQDSEEESSDSEEESEEDDL